MIEWTVPARRKTLSRHTPGESVLTAPSIDDPVNDASIAVRRIIDALARTAPGDGGLPPVVARLERIAEVLETGAHPVETQLTRIWRGEGVARHDPATGPENPIAPPLTMYDRGDGWAEGTVELGLPYQGPPAVVHGGVCALLLDGALAVANQLSGVGGMTAELTVSYHLPTPLYVPLKVRARQVRRDGRKLFTVGEIVAGDRVTSSARGLFIVAAGVAEHA